MSGPAQPVYFGVNPAVQVTRLTTSRDDYHAILGHNSEMERMC